MPRPLFVLGPFDFDSGYHHVVINCVRSLLMAGMDVRIDSRCRMGPITPMELRGLHEPSLRDDWKLFVYPLNQLHAEGLEPLYPITVDKRTIVLTMWEGTELKPHWIDRLNRAALVVVPSQWNVVTFQAAGVTVPIVKVPLGYDPDLYCPARARSFKTVPDSEQVPDNQIVAAYQEALPAIRQMISKGLADSPEAEELAIEMDGLWRRMSKVDQATVKFRVRVSDQMPEICTFGTAGMMAGGGFRKNIDMAAVLFTAAFPNEQDVRLKIKLTPYCKWTFPEMCLVDDRIEVLPAKLDDEDLADWYRGLTCYLNCSSGEGFGLHLLEAMACGRPLISMAYSGLTEYFDSSVGYVGDFDFVPVPPEYHLFYTGTWPIPNGLSFIQRMREVYRDQKTAKLKGEEAAKRARGFTWERMGERLALQLKKLMNGEGKVKRLEPVGRRRTG